jgi:hypothetical protein
VATAKRLEYVKKASQFVIAVRLDLEMDGIEYRKWGGLQRAKRGDWLVDNQGDVYTVDAKTFARTYRPLLGGKRRPTGRYMKITPVWAQLATAPGKIKTKEGASSYKRGDYIVYNNRDGTDGYSISAARFKTMYRRRPARRRKSG